MAIALRVLWPLRVLQASEYHDDVLRIQKSNARELQPTYREITSVGMQNKVPFN